MSLSTAHLVHRPHMPHPDLHRITDAVHKAQQRARAVLAVEDTHECTRHEFLEDALMSREMGRL
jgi:hypothetical protein